MQEESSEVQGLLNYGGNTLVSMVMVKCAAASGTLHHHLYADKTSTYPA